MPRTLRLCIAVVALTLACVPTHAGPAEDFKKGLDFDSTGNYAEAVKWYLKAAEQGHYLSPFFLGVRYRDGRGVTQDYAEAVKWFSKIASQGKSEAQYNLGVLYQNGQGVTQDYVTAHMWFNLAGSLGYTSGRENRDKMEKSMTQAQIAEAQRRARVCQANNYKNCD
jgi:TPR repeat protein